MLFNSWQFILVFLPVVFFVYFWLNQQRLPLASRAWLVAASLFFYAYWNIVYLPLILGSMLVNFAIGSSFAPHRTPRRTAICKKMVLALGLTANLGLLAYYEYADFWSETSISWSEQTILSTGGRASTRNQLLYLSANCLSYR